MKNNKKVYRKKYNSGGYIDPLATNNISGQPINYVPNPNEALTQNNINVAKALYKTKSNPYTQILDFIGNAGIQIGTSIMGQGNNGLWGDLATKGVSAIGGAAQGINSKYATGGLVPINVEGEEVIETPFGNIEEFIGDSHEQGGINVSVPQGSEIFSKRVKGEDGNTMAQRKLNREKQLKRLEKVYNNNPTNSAIRKAYEKTKKDFELIEQKDILEMEALNQALSENSKGTKTKFKSGGKVKPVRQINTDFINSMFSGSYSDNFTPEVKYRVEVEPKKISKPLYEDVVNDLGIANINYTEQPKGEDIPKKSFDWKGLGNTVSNNIPQTTFGDILGIAGQVYGYENLMKNTLEQRATDTPNINPYRDFGKRGLQTIQNNKQYVNQIRDNILKDLETTSNSLRLRNRNSARGVNTLRALDIASELSLNDAKNATYNNFLNAMSNLYSQEAQQQNAIDSAVMRGEYQRDLADRQDKDNFYTNLARDIASKGFGMQNVAKSINDIYERQTKQTTLNSLFNDYEVNAFNGQTKRKAIEAIQKNPSFFDSIPQEERADFLKKLTKYNLTIKGDMLVDNFGNFYTVEQISNLK